MNNRTLNGDRTTDPQNASPNDIPAISVQSLYCNAFNMPQVLDFGNRKLDQVFGERKH